MPRSRWSSPARVRPRRGRPARCADAGREVGLSRSRTSVAGARHEGEQPEVRRGATHRLGPELTMAGGEVHLLVGGLGSPPARGFDRQGGRRVADHLTAACGGDDPVLANAGERRARPERGDRRQLEGVEVRRHALPEAGFERAERARVGRRGPHHPVRLPPASHVGGGDALRPVRQHIRDEGLQVTRTQGVEGVTSSVGKRGPHASRRGVARWGAGHGGTLVTTGHTKPGPKPGSCCRCRLEDQRMMARAMPVVSRIDGTRPQMKALT